jgi:hypothetical protein
MAYRFRVDESVGDGLRRIATEQLDRALAEVGGRDRDAAVHSMRERSKKLRALLRLVRPAFGDAFDAENARFRDAARPLSAIRDAAALVGAYDALMDHFRAEVARRTFAPVRRALVRHRRVQPGSKGEVAALLEAFAVEARRAREAVAGWALDADGFDALGGGLERTYRHGRRAFEAAREEPADERLHAWRKRAKDHWYHTRLLRDVWAPVVQARRREARRLAALLGDDHDLAVLAGFLREEGDGFESERTRQALLGLIDRRRGELQALARPLGARLYAEPPGALADRFGAYWDAWHDEAASDPALAPSHVALVEG